MNGFITPADERTAIWSSIVRFAMVGTAILTGCLILLPVAPPGPVAVTVLVIGILTTLGLAKLAWMAVSFVIADQREHE